MPQELGDAAGLPKLVKGELDWIVMKCLEKKPENRFRDFAELRQALERWTIAGDAFDKSWKDALLSPGPDGFPPETFCSCSPLSSSLSSRTSKLALERTPAFSSP